MENVNKKMNPMAGEVNRSWGWLLALGFLLVILGMLGLGMVVGVTMASMLFIGILLIAGGFVQIIDAFKSKHWKAVFWHALIAVLYIFAGILVVRDPMIASTMITAFLAATLIIIGLARLIMGFTLRDTRGWFWLVIAGLLAIALGAIILAHWPWSGLWVIGLFISIDMIVYGWTYIFLAFALR